MRQVLALFSKCVLECVSPPPHPPHPPHPPLAYVEALYPGMLLSVTTCTWRSLPAIHARHISHHLSQLDLSGSYFAGLSLSILHVFWLIYLKKTLTTASPSFMTKWILISKDMLTIHSSAFTASVFLRRFPPSCKGESSLEERCFSSLMTVLLQVPFSLP